MSKTFPRLGSWRLMTLLTVVSFGAHAQQRSAPPIARQGTHAGRPLSDFLTPDGQLRPGASGSFDPSGYRMRADPATGQPTFRITGAGDEDWQGALGAGLGDGSVYALAVAPNGDVYAGGSFTDAGGNPNADFIFRWDGTSLHALGTGLNGGVGALAVAANGDVYVGGGFTDAGGNPDADGIARWDGTSWQALGSGLQIYNNGVSDLKVWGNLLYVAGSFFDAGGVSNASNIAVWNGTNWAKVGPGLQVGVTSVAVTPNGDVYAGGHFFDAAGDPNADMIVRWNGTSWQGLGTGLDDLVQGLSVAPNGDVIAAGFFDNAGGNPNADQVARWDGTSWQALGTGISGGPYDVLAASDGDVYVAGFFTDSTNTVNAYTAHWNGTSWQPISPDLNRFSYALAEAANGDIWHGGSFWEAGDTPTPFQIARWTGTTWLAPATVGVNNQVNALAVGTNGEVYMGGLFTDAGGNPGADYVVMWDGYGWYGLGTGLNGQVRALTLAPNGDLYVGGDFTDAGGNPAADGVARWDGSSWHSLGAGLDGGVHALAVAANGDVYVGGFFADAGGNPNADNIARWDGTSFQALGTGTNGTVQALAVAASGDVWVGGAFDNAGGNANAAFVARWNGSSFQALGPVLDGGVTSLAVAGPGQVWIGGHFLNAGGNPAADYVTRWDGTSYQALGSALNNDVYALAAMGTSQVYVGGNFTDAGGNVNADRVALWNGTSWEPLGTGLNDLPRALVAGTAGQLYAGGDFTTVGDGSKTLNRFGIHFAPSLIVSSPQNVPAGAYHNVTVTGTGVATLSGDISITGTLLVEEGGVLHTGNGSTCATITGPGEFLMGYNTQLNICSPDGITDEDPIGNVQVTGYRYFNGEAKYVYDGTTAQVTGDGLESSVLELEIDNAAGVTLSRRVSVYRALRLTSGTLNTAGLRLRLLSYGDHTAYAVHTGGTTSGNVTVQRYIPGTTAVSYHHLSSPVQNSTVADLATNGFTPKVNPAYNNLPTPRLSASQMPNVFGFDETRGGTNPAYQSFAIGYYSPAALGTTLTPGRGYSVAIGGDLLPDFVGNLTTGNVSAPLSVTGTNTSPNTQKAGWHLLGNPYPQPIDWDLVTAPAGMIGSVSVWYSTGGNNGAYRTRNASGAGNLADGLIGIGQGFFVRATAPTTFTFTNALRVENDAVPLGRAAVAPRPGLRLQLAATGAPAETADEVLVYEEEGATRGFDSSFDATRPAHNVGVPTLLALVEGEEVAISAMPAGSLKAGTTVELLLDLPAAGAYTLGVAALTNLPDATLLDRLTNTRYDLTTRKTMAFTGTQAGELRGRFALVFGDQIAGTTTALTLWPNPAHGTVRVSLPAGVSGLELLDATGRVVRRQAAGGETSVSLTNLPAGVYVVRAGTLTQRLIVE